MSRDVCAQLPRICFIIIILLLLKYTYINFNSSKILVQSSYKGNWIWYHRLIHSVLFTCMFYPKFCTPILLPSLLRLLLCSYCVLLQYTYSSCYSSSQCDVELHCNTGNGLFKQWQLHSSLVISLTQIQHDILYSVNITPDALAVQATAMIITPSTLHSLMAVLTMWSSWQLVPSVRVISVLLQCWDGLTLTTCTAALVLLRQCTVSDHKKVQITDIHNSIQSSHLS